MSTEELRELAALYALDALEGEDKERFEKALRSTPEAASILSEYSSAVDELPFAVELREPPESLEEKVFSNLPPQSSTAPVTDFPKERESRSVLSLWVPWGAAAVFALGCVLLWNELSTREEVIAAQDEELENKEQLIEEGEAHSNELETRLADRDRVIGEQTVVLEERERLLQEQEEAIQDFLVRISEQGKQIVALEQKSALDNLRIAVLKSQVEAAPDAEAVAVWDVDSQKGRLSVSNLPAVPMGKDYQLWLINSDLGAPVSAGVFNTDDSGNSQYSFSGNSELERVDTFALSLEDEGGKPAPEGPIVLVGN